MGIKQPILVPNRKTYADARLLIRSGDFALYQAGSHEYCNRIIAARGRTYCHAGLLF